MKKLVFLLVTLSMLFSLPAFSVSADSAILGEYNLAINQYNWHKPTVSAAKVEFLHEGIKFSNMTQSQAACTYYRGDSIGQFTMSMVLDANLNVPPEDSGAQWRYSNFIITFLVDKDPENAIAEWAVPWQTNKAYMGLQLGLDAFGNPLCTFIRYNSFANNASVFNYVGTSSSTNIADGDEHFIELTVRNFSKERGSLTVTGKEMTCTVDGSVAAKFEYEDGKYYDSTSGKDYQVNMSALKGGFGFFTNSDWPTGYSQSEMNNTVLIKELQIRCFDDSAEGFLLAQLTEPFFPIEVDDYVTQLNYEVGEEIEIKLEDLFKYEGTRERTYTVTSDGEPIGEIKNGFWIWTPTLEGAYDIDFRCEIQPDNFAVNYLTFRTVGQMPTTPTSRKGCKGEAGYYGSIFALFALGLIFIKKDGQKQ